MRVKIGNQKAAQYMLSNDSCQKCIFYSNSLAFYITMDCDINGIFLKLELWRDF